MNINISGYNSCSSCGLCKVSCPHNAIVFDLDNCGFYRPTILTDICTDCGICYKVCYKYIKTKEPFENTFKDKSIYAAWSKNIDIIHSSSSGGVGHELATYFFDKGYKICGCIFDAPSDICKHIFAESTDDLAAIRTSKYLQSYTVDAFSRLKKDEKYLILGTPCQIYGMRKWIQLKHWEDNFILIDFFCHGTPSFNLWKKYKKYIIKKKNLDTKFKYVNFRKKHPESKWHKNAILIQDASGKKIVQSDAFSKDLFFLFFLNESCLNDACYQCKLRLDHCVADIRIADFWGRKYASNENGVSMVIANTEKGQTVLEAIKTSLIVEKCNFDDLQQSQHKRFISANKKREIILKELQGNNNLISIWNKYFRIEKIYRKSIIGRCLSFIKRRLC
jgi:coenzyme F420-reducing hydrogenase beta subunit